MAKLAITEHPYYPDTWLDKEQAQQKLTDAGFTGTRLTVAWCKQHSVNVASTGHVGASSLQYAIDMMRAEDEQKEQDLVGRIPDEYPRDYYSPIAQVKRVNYPYAIPEYPCEPQETNWYEC